MLNSKWKLSEEKREYFSLNDTAQPIKYNCIEQIKKITMQVD